MTPLFIAFVIADVIITAAVVLFVVRRRIAMGTVVLPAGLSTDELSQIRPLTAFAMERQQRITDFVRANWSGDPAQLHGVLASLVDQLDSEARADGHSFSRALLKTVLVSTLRSQKLARPAEIEQALQRVA